MMSQESEVLMGYPGYNKIVSDRQSATSEESASLFDAINQRYLVHLRRNKLCCVSHVSSVWTYSLNCGWRINEKKVVFILPQFVAARARNPSNVHFTVTCQSKLLSRPTVDTVAALKCNVVRNIVCVNVCVHNVCVHNDILFESLVFLSVIFTVIVPWYVTRCISNQIPSYLLSVLKTICKRAIH